MFTKFLRKGTSTLPVPAPTLVGHRESLTPGNPIYLISMASFPNYGDELITLRWLQHLAHTHPNSDIWLDVREPGLASSLFADAHPRLRVTNTLFRAIHEHLHGDIRTPADKVKNLGSPHYDLGLLDLRSAGTIHLLGGGYINSVWPHNTLIVDAMRAAQAISGARLVTTGQGLMPFANEIFEDFEHVSVRDIASADALGIEKGLDDAFLLPTSPLSWQAPSTQTLNDPEKLTLYICVQNDALDPGAHEAMVAYARQQIEAFNIPRERTFYVEAIPGADYAGYAALQDLIAEGGFIPFAHFWRSGFTYDPHQVWITSRFHHHLNAALYGARGIALSGKLGYYDIKHSSLKDLGTHWEIVNPLNTQPIPYNLGQLSPPDSMNTYVATKQAEARHLYPVK